MITFNCWECGIEMGMDEKIRDLWTKSRKQFWCFNGHSLIFTPPVDNPEVTNEEIASLKAQLSSKNEQIEELKSKLEVWEPRADA